VSQRGLREKTHGAEEKEHGVTMRQKKELLTKTTKEREGAAGATGRGVTLRGGPVFANQSPPVRGTTRGAAGRSGRAGEGEETLRGRLSALDTGTTGKGGEG